VKAAKLKRHVKMMDGQACTTTNSALCQLQELQCHTVTVREPDSVSLIMQIVQFQVRELRANAQVTPTLMVITQLQTLQAAETVNFVVQARESRQHQGVQPMQFSQASQIMVPQLV